MPIALATTAAAGVVVTAEVASAAPGPYWQTFTYTAKWHCNQLASGPEVSACVVVNGRAAQGVLVVGNSRTRTFYMNVALVDLIKNRATVAHGACNYSQLSVNYTRACFGSTVTGECGQGVQSWVHIVVKEPRSSDYLAEGFSPTVNYCS